MTTAAALETSIMARLKAETQALHTEAEHTPFQQAFVAGKLPLPLYVDSLEQLLLVHRALEQRLERLRRTDERARAVVQEYQFHEANIAADLVFFGRGMDDAPGAPETAELIAEIERIADKEPTALLGLHYVLEGSKNGAKYLAKAARHMFSLTDGGLRYLDPYGDQQRLYWAEFKRAMDSAEFSPAEADSIVSAAKAMFRGITRLYLALMPKV